jgi:HEPN domain-containing protein
MNPLTLEWVDKAEGDLLTARREYRVRKSPNFDAVCFHSQQAAEKYMKAVLQENGMPIPRIHSLADLLVLITKIDPGYLAIQADANVLEGYAVQFRYPGLSAN